MCRPHPPQVRAASSTCALSESDSGDGLPQVDDLKQFRQWESCTPGHPENFLTEGVEVTTGDPAFSLRTPQHCHSARRVCA